MNKKNKFFIKDRIKGFLWVFFFLVILWLLLSSTFHYQELWVGIVVSFIISLFAHEFYIKIGFPPVSPKRFGFFFLYIFILFYEIIKANFDVASRVIRPSLPINPGVVVIKTKLKSDIAKTILANSITLTPGTFTLDIECDRLLIHWIDVKSTDVETNTYIIGARFEKYLRIIFQ